MNAQTLTPNFVAIRQDFPIFTGLNRTKPIVYLDSSSSAQKPKQVIEALQHFYLNNYANIHRGIYELSERSSKLYEDARDIVRDFLKIPNSHDVIFVRGTTEGINLVAQSYARQNFKLGDEIILSEMEHHSNIVPWYLLREQIGVVLKVIPIHDNGELNLEAYKKLFSSRTKLVAVTHASNVLGTINPVEMLTELAHDHNVPILLDGAQAVPHMPVDIEDIDCDFYVFSSHKLYGPTGIGVLIARKSLTQQMAPYQGGGGMIDSVRFDEIKFAKSPHVFEAGTPDIAGTVGMGAAIRYLDKIGMQAIFEHEQILLEYALHELKKISDIRIFGTAQPKLGVISFVLDNIHAHDVGTVLDNEGIAIRAGHHCAMPLMERFKVPAMVRVSFGMYNNEGDIDKLIAALKTAQGIFA